MLRGDGALREEQGKLMSANLGDSGFALLGRRPYHQDLCIKWHSPQQERFFGCPYQLGHHETANTAEEAQCFTISVRCGVCVRLFVYEPSRASCLAGHTHGECCKCADGYAVARVTCCKCVGGRGPTRLKC